MRKSQDTAEERQRVACVGKVIFHTPNAADRRAKIMRRNHDRPFVAYRCEFCRCWHIGSRDGWRGRPM